MIVFALTTGVQGQDDGMDALMSAMIAAKIHQDSIDMSNLVVVYDYECQTLNASVSQPFLKGKLIARIEAFDILHQLSNTQYTVNAQGRTETWYHSLPHYVMLHLVYHWNKNPKKK